MNITQFSLKNNVFTLSIIAILLIAGLMVFNQMPRDDMPPFTVRFVNIVTPFPGASPERVELLVTDKLEKVIQEMPEIKNITSESRTGISIITVAIKESYNVMQPIYDKLRRKLETAQSELPEGVTYTVNDEGIVDVFGIIIGLRADGYSYAELRDIAEDIKDELIKLPDAAKVEISGIQEEQIFMEYDNARLAEMGLTAQQLKNIISSTNIIFPGGDILLNGERIVLEPTGNYESVDDIKQTILSSQSQSNLMFLRDVTDIYRGYKDPPQSLVRINGKPGLAIGINLKEGGNIVYLGQEVNKKIAEFQKQYPIGVELLRSASADLVVEKSVNDFVGNLIQSVVVVLAVMFLFLGLRTGVVVSTLIPSTMVMTLLLMHVVDEGLNTVSLAALIIALGMLVDNAIVMTESILVKMQNGAGSVEAALDSAKELFTPLLVSSLTTAAAFLPFFLAQSTIGEIVSPIFVVVSLALMSSWLLSMTMIPLISTKVLKEAKGKKENARFLSMMDRYKAILLFNLRRPYLLLGGLPLLFILAGWANRFIPNIFMPDSDRNLVTVNLELPLGTDIRETEQTVKTLEAFVQKELLVNQEREKGIVDFSSYLGEGAPKYDLGYMPPEASPNNAHILLNTSSNDENQMVIDALDTFCLNHFPDVRPTISRLATGGGSSVPIEIRLSGKNLEKLYDIVDEVRAYVRNIPGTKNVKDDWGMRVKKFVIDVDQTKAQLAGLTNQDIALSLQSAFSGYRTGIYREEDLSIPIMMRYSENKPEGLEPLESINIYAQQSGQNVPLKQVADIKVAWQPSKVKRYDLYRTITVEAEVETGVTAASVMQKVTPWLEEQASNWGVGFYYELGGEAEDSSEGIGSVKDQLPFAFFIIVLLLIGQFNSLKKPLIVLLTIPLGVIGVLFGLLITGSYFGFFAFLGIISLAGIVINNGIVLLDRIQIELDEMGRTTQEAIIEAALQRFRPILLTTATTICGLVPLWVGGGIMFEPLAISIIFGLLFATVITLLFVPVMYKVLFRVSYKNFTL